MPRRCTVCDHPNQLDVETLLLEGTPLRTIADHHNVSKTALIRHRDDHLPAHLAKAHEAEEIAGADALLTDLRKFHAATWKVLYEADTSGDHVTILRAVREARANLELLAKLTERLGDDSPTVNINLDNRVRTVILGALQDFPDAKIAVAKALREAEDYE